ncbi:MAG: hypothetical protein ACR2K0_02095 [Acidimicrobiales bacterium]
MAELEDGAGGPVRPKPFALEELDRRARRYAWLERRRFEVLGGWTATVPEPEVKAMVATHAHHHAWHASLWDRHRPHRSGHDATAGGAPVGDALVACIDAVAGPPGDGATIERLVGAYRVVAPYAAAAYGADLDRASSISDAPLVRSCRLVLADQLDDWREGERALQALLATDAAIDRAAACQGRLEKLLLAAGGVGGNAVGRAEGAPFQAPLR